MKVLIVSTSSVVSVPVKSGMPRSAAVGGAVTAHAALNRNMRDRRQRGAGGMSRAAPCRMSRPA